MKNKAFISAFAAMLAFLVVASIATMAFSAGKHSETETILMESQIVDQRYAEAGKVLWRVYADYFIDSQCPGFTGVLNTQYYGAAVDPVNNFLSSDGVVVTLNSLTPPAWGSGADVDYVTIAADIKVESNAPVSETVKRVSKTGSVSFKEYLKCDPPAALVHECHLGAGASAVTVTFTC